MVKVPGLVGKGKVRGVCSPHGGLHRAVIGLPVVKLREEREQHLDAPDGVDSTVDGVGDDGLYILHTENNALALFTC